MTDHPPGPQIGHFRQLVRQNILVGHQKIRSGIGVVFPEMSYLAVRIELES
jgi:hypothetical protein